MRKLKPSVKFTAEDAKNAEILNNTEKMKRIFNILSTTIFVSGLFLILSGMAENTFADNPSVDYNALARKAEKLNTKHKYQQVINLLKPHAEDTNNKNPYFFNELGTAYFIKQDYKNANKYFAAAHLLDKEDAKTIYNLAGTFALLNNYDEALKLFKLAESKGFDKKLIDEWIVWIKKKR